MFPNTNFLICIFDCWYFIIQNIVLKSEIGNKLSSLSILIVSKTWMVSFLNTSSLSQDFFTDLIQFFNTRREPRYFWNNFYCDFILYLINMFNSIFKIWAS